MFDSYEMELYSVGHELYNESHTVQYTAKFSENTNQNLKPNTVKKSQRFSRLQPACHLPNSPCPVPVIIKLFPAKESLVIDIPAGDGKIVNLFFTVQLQSKLADLLKP